MPPCIKKSAHALGIDPGPTVWGPANRSGLRGGGRRGRRGGSGNCAWYVKSIKKYKKVNKL